MRLCDTGAVTIARPLSALAFAVLNVAPVAAQYEYQPPSPPAATISFGGATGSYGSTDVAHAQLNVGSGSYGATSLSHSQLQAGSGDRGASGSYGSTSLSHSHHTGASGSYGSTSYSHSHAQAASGDGGASGSYGSTSYSHSHAQAASGDGGASGQSSAADNAESDDSKPPAFFNAGQCRGREQEVVACEGLPSCRYCTPQDCHFAEWNDWYPLGGCTGLCVRKRLVAQPNNECGQPCTGTQMQTISRRDCYPDYEACQLKVRDCLWEEWGSWSNTCRSAMGALKKTEQRYRKRSILQVAVNGGRPCVGGFNQTEPCNARTFEKLDCLLSEWNAWTDCSATCGGGWHARLRRVVQHAQHGGLPCEEDIRQQELCNFQPCSGNVGCVVGEWSEWHGCDILSPAQEYRSRRILHPPRGNGDPCNHVLKETRGCPDEPEEAKVCVLSEWSQWSRCSATCGGQSVRARRVPVDQPNCFADRGYSLDETKPCGVPKCIVAECVLSEWSAWSQCSQACGFGVHVRSRNVLSANTESSCEKTLEEVAPCSYGACKKVDCVWGEWDHWSACTCSCGGGTKRRNRVVAQAPRHGGETCPPQDKSEIAPCNTQTCKLCIDGRWGAWGKWSQCTATCEPSLRARHRSVSVHPNYCGAPAIGTEDEYEVCRGQPACIVDQDCTLSEWGSWTSCSCKCFGVRERHRTVNNYAVGKGRTCLDESLKEVQPCFPGPGEAVPEDCAPDPKRPCQMGEWEEWETCSVSCGGGERLRSRSILVPAADNGPPCDNSMQHVEACNTQDCIENCIDCLWGAWSDWGDCSKCGDQRYRHRAIERMPNHCGKKCIMQVAKEVGTCKSHCADHNFCSWSEWEVMGECSAGCGPSTKTLQRQLKISKTKPIPKVETMGGTGGMCRDAQGRSFSACPIEAFNQHACEQELLRLSGLTGVRGAMYVGGASIDIDVGKRHCFILVDPDVNVSVAKIPGGWLAKPCILGQARGDIASVGDAGEGVDKWICLKLNAMPFMEGDESMPCSGTQLYQSTCDSKRCEDECLAEDCLLGEWSMWSAPTCTQLCERSRVIKRQNRCGGNACSGQLVETKRCWKNCTAPVDCELAEWSVWHPPECVTHSDQRQRERAVLRNAKNGGKSCAGAIRETMPCSGTPVPVVDCKLGEWTEWSKCNRDCDAGLRTRSRSIMEPASGGGQSCVGSLAEMGVCSNGPCERSMKRDGSFAEWSEWSKCNAENMRFRARKVDVEAQGGGVAAKGEVLQAETCGEVIDCVVSAWAPWDACDRSCGGGQQQRTRQVTTNPRNGGKECLQDLTMTRGCQMQPCRKVDCEVSEWSEWGRCSASCGNGMRERSRTIQQLSEADGAGCELPLAEYETCYGSKASGGLACPSEGDCDCVWGEWTEWSSCSCECNGGQKTRDRHIQKAPGPGCKPCEPSDKEQIAPCNTQKCGDQQCIDALWGEWAEWEPCSASCKGGITWRSRRIKRQASECGRPATGLSMQHSACNEGVTCVPSADCVFGHWGAWSGCSQECDGVKRRSRTILEPGRGDGKFCLGALKQTYPCSTGVGLLEFSSPALYLHLDNLGTNNLDGRIPGEQEEIRYKDATKMPGTDVSVDVVVKPQGNYRAGRADANGLLGAVGSVGTEVDTTLRITIEIVQPNGDAVKAKMLMIKFFDISDGSSIVVDDYDQVFLSPETQLTVTEKGLDSTQIKRAQISSAVPSVGAPRDPMSLSPQQETQSAAVLFKDTGRVTVAFTPARGSSRSLLFGGKACFRGDCLVSACGRGEDAVDCVLEEWSAWGPCDADCGPGQRVRSRQVKTMNSHGGRPCHVALSEMEPCEDHPCKKACLPQNCSWGHWTEWGACDKCGGQQKRFRQIAQMSLCGGARCEAAAAEEIKKCPRKCHELSYCVWDDWGKFGECTQTCGSGTKTRERRLKVVQEPLGIQRLSDSSKLGADELRQKLDELEERASSMEAKRQQQLAAAFSAGFVGFVALLAFGRRSTWLANDQHLYSPAFTEPISDAE